MDIGDIPDPFLGLNEKVNHLYLLSIVLYAIF